MEESIRLVQSPVIRHNLAETGKSVTARISALNLENLVATEDTVKTLKSLRAELNGEANVFEAQRKAVKEAVLSPYNEFEAVYKTEINEKYKNADTLLKEKINAFEMSIKREIKNNLTAWFNEICAVEGIGWLTFDRLNIEINLSTGEKKYRERISGEIGRIRDDLAMIASDGYSAEILVEYKKTLNAPQAVQTVRQRKEAERIEAERIRDDRTALRTNLLLGLSFVYHDLTKTYNWIFDESVMIPFSEVENLPEEEWDNRFASPEAKAACKKDGTQAAVTVLKAPETVEHPSAETEEGEKEEIFNAKFIVSGTYTRLKALGEFLKSNNYNYQNID